MMLGMAEIVPPWLQDAAERARHAERIADDVFDEVGCEAAGSWSPAMVRRALLLAARRGLGLRD